MIKNSVRKRRIGPSSLGRIVTLVSGLCIGGSIPLTANSRYTLGYSWANPFAVPETESGPKACERRSYSRGMSEGNPILRAQSAPRRIADLDIRGSQRVVPLTVLAAAGVAVIWLVDISTGPDFGFAIFYLIPIGLASWWLGRASAVLIALLATAAWIWADLLARPSVLPAASLWNGLTRAAIFLMLALLIDQVRRERTALRSVDADPERLRTAVEHILNNALRFSPPGSTVHVTVGQRDNRARVVVKDQGVGLARAHLGVIFRKYGRIETPATKDKIGVGLGLYVARLIVEAQNGTVSASSVGLGLGSTFTLDLPLASHQA